MQTNVANTGMYELAVSDMQLVAGGGWGEALGYGALGAFVGAGAGAVVGGGVGATVGTIAGAMQ